MMKHWSTKWWVTLDLNIDIMSESIWMVKINKNIQAWLYMQTIKVS